MRPITRTMSFFSKWLVEIVRQPALMLTLVLGPFLVLLAFGQGVDVGGPRPKLMVVQPEEDIGPIQPLPEELSQHVEFVGETRDREYAIEQLRLGRIDAVAVVPPDPVQTLESGQHVKLETSINEIDPITLGYYRAYLRNQVAELNQRTIAKAVGEAQGSLLQIQQGAREARPMLDALRSGQGDLENARTQVREMRGIIDPLSDAVDDANTALRGARFFVPGLSRPAEQVSRLQQQLSDLQRDLAQLDSRLNSSEAAALPTEEELDQIQARLDELDQVATSMGGIPPEVLSEPFQLELENVAPFVPTFTAFYSPPVLVLLIQHLAITLGALSMTRIRLLGVINFLRVAPVRASEVVVGNYLSYGLLSALVGAALLAAIVLLLDVPVFGSWLVLALGIGLLIAVSLGVGFVVSILATSEQQAAQVAMLILLGAIFFSGFVFSLDRITWPVRIISYALPSTYAIRTFQDVMLRGVLRHPEDLWVLAGAAVVLFALTVALFRREFRPT